MKIYADNAATTMMSNSAMAAILPYMQEYYGNPSSLHNIGQKAAEALDGLSVYKMHCSVLAEEAIKAAVKDYYDKNGIVYDKSKFPDCNSYSHGCNE